MLKDPILKLGLDFDPEFGIQFDTLVITISYQEIEGEAYKIIENFKDKYYYDNEILYDNAEIFGEPI